MPKRFLQTHSSCSMQKTALKNSSYSKKESILKMAKNGYDAKTHAKYSVWVKKKLPKTCENRLYKHIQVVVCKKRLQKTENIRKMRAF